MKNGLIRSINLKKIVFILPYFGKFNNYFDLFLKSCEYNESINWLIFTDDYKEYNYPANVKVHYMQFEELKTLIKSKFNFDAIIDSPYKLCDYKPAYGYIFEEYIQDYDYWGHCDCDLIFGDIRKFITEDKLDIFDKLFCLGHCTLYKNSEEINRVFMKQLGDEKPFKKVYSSSDSFTFDEEYLSCNVNEIFLEHGYKVLEDDYSANISGRHPDFRVVRFDQLSRNYIMEEKNKNFFIFDKGKIKKYQKKFHDLRITEYMYIHLQSRKMDVCTNNYNKYKIVTNRFTDLEFENINDDNFDQVRTIYPNNFRTRFIKSEIKFWTKRIMKKIVNK